MFKRKSKYYGRDIHQEKSFSYSDSWSVSVVRSHGFLVAF